MITTTDIFGPVTAVVRFDDVDEAVRIANDTIYGLMAYVFGEEREAMAVARRLEAGTAESSRAVWAATAAPRFLLEFPRGEVHRPDGLTRAAALPRTRNPAN